MGAFIRDVIRAKPIKIGCMILGSVAVALVIVWVRAFYGSMQAYQQGEAYLTKDQHTKAITFFDRSMHWYAPFNPYGRQSAERLWEIGLWAEQQGDIHLALIAVRTIRRGFYAAKGIYVPGKDWIKKCDAKINELMEIRQTNRESPRGSGAPAKSTPGSQEAMSLSTTWSIIVEIGFLGWIGSVIAFIMFACRGSGKAHLLTSSALIWGSLYLIFFALWIVAMMKA